MFSAFLGGWQVPLTIGLGAFASLGYLISLARHRRHPLTLLDGLVIVALMVLVTAVAIPVLESAADGARRSSVLQNLQAIRSQVELYKLQHGGEPPLLYQGTFPQLIEATDAAGQPGLKGRNHPYGPYFPSGLPCNPVTGRAGVAATDEFPPQAASGNGGWLYHQPTGQIAIDLPDMLLR